MSAKRKLERVVLIATVLGLAYSAYGQRRTRHLVQDLQDEVRDLQVKVRVLEEGNTARFRAPPPSAFKAPTPPPTRPQRGAPMPKPKVPPVPGAQVLDTLYSAADALAQEQDWDAQTYDDVALVFEDTTAEMMSLWNAMQANEITAQQARKEAVALRDRATDELGRILGPDGLVRLRDAVRDEMPAKRRP